MRTAWKSFIAVTVVLCFALYFTGCSEDNEIISDNDIDTPSTNTITGCVGCHTDAALLEELAIPEEDSGSSGEG